MALRRPTTSDFQLLLFVIALAAGTTWLIGPVSSKPAPPPIPPVTPELSADVVTTRPPEPTYTPVTFPKEKFAPPTFPKQAPKQDLSKAETLKQDPEKLREELEEAEKAAKERLEQLQASKADLANTQAAIDALKAEIAALEAKRLALGPIGPELNDQAEIEKLSALVDQRREEVGALKANLESIKLPEELPVDDGSKLTRAVAPKDKLPIPVELFNNQIAPVTKDYFKFPSAATKKAEFVVTRHRKGESIEEASKPASSFEKFLTKVKGDHQYVLLLVNADSFDAFYAARELAIKAGVEIAWQPADTTDGTIPIVHVVQPSKGSKGLVRLPDVVE